MITWRYTPSDFADLRPKSQKIFAGALGEVPGASLVRSKSLTGLAIVDAVDFSRVWKQALDDRKLDFIDMVVFRLSKDDQY